MGKKIEHEGLTHGDFIRNICGVLSEEKKALLERHVKECAVCRRRVDFWKNAKAEDAEKVKRVQSLPWNDLCEEFKRALRNGDASVMRPIVERMIADCNSGNRRSMPQLIIASIRGPGVTRGIAKDFLDSL